MKRSYSIDFIKFIFAIAIAIGHAHYSESIISSGLIVNLFFVLSGYFLVNSFESEKYDNSWQYSFQRIKRIYPYYIFAFIVLFMYTNLCKKLDVVSLSKLFFKSLPEIFLVQNVGIFPGGINYPLWQLCTLIVVSHIMFSMLKWDKQFTINVICPIVAIGVYTYLSNVYDSGVPNDWGVEYKFLYVPLIRAAGSLAIGMFANYPIKRCLVWLENNKNKLLPITVSLLGMCAGVVFWLNRNSYSSIIPFLVVIISMLYTKSVYSRMFRARIFRKLDKLSLAIYLNHAFVINVYDKMSDVWLKSGYEKTNIMYLILLIIYSMIMLWLVDAVCFLIKKYIVVLFVE